MPMSTDNPLSGHMAGTNDGLRDGDHILSPSLTNLYEGVHGNGLLLPHDTAYNDNDRNDPTNLPGALSAGAAANQFVVKAHDTILDGVLYSVATDTTVTLTSTTTQRLHTFTALSSGQECLFVVLATPEGVKVTQTTPITTAVGSYASISGTAASYLTDGVASGDNRQSIVLATVRAVNSGGSTVGDLNIQSLSELNDKRVFVRPSPIYMSPVRDGDKTSTTGINDHTALAQVHGTGQHGNFGDAGVVWQSFNGNGESMLYYSSKDSSNRHTHLLGPTNMSVSSPSTNQTFTFDSDQVFVLTASSTITLNPSGTFPPGHTVFVSVPSGSTVTFDSTGLNQAVTAGDAVMFAYDGSNWKTVLFSSTVGTTSSGSSGLVQLSDGAGGFTSDSTLSYDTAANELTVDGKLTVTGLIDPTGLVLEPQATNPEPGSPPNDNTLWIKTTDSRMWQGSVAVMRAGDDISELSNDAGFVDAAGAAAAAPATDLAYDAASRTVSSSTGTNAVITEVAAGGNSGLMTGADKTKLDGIATSATNTAAPAIEDSAGTPAFASGITKAEVQTLLNIEDGATADQSAAEVSVAATPTNYSAGTADVEAHLAGIDTALASAGGGAVDSVNTQTGTVVLDADDLADGSTNVMMTSAERTKLTGIETAATADQSAAEVPVAATPTNYTAATADVEAHLSGIDAAIGGVSVTETDPVFTASAAASITNAGSGLVTTSAERTNWNAAFGWGDHGAAGYLTSAPAPDLLLLDSNGVNMTAGTKASWNTLTNFIARTSSGTAPTYNAPLGQITINASGTYEMILSIVFRNATSGWGLAWSSTYTNYTRMWVTRGATTELGPVQMTYSSSMQNTLVRVLELQAGDIITPVVYWNMPFSSMECFENSPTTIGFQNYCMIRKVS